jgi:hypothetical protein
MSEHDERLPGGGVRRVGRKDRKKSIETRGPLFPPEEDFVPEPEEVEGYEEQPAVVQTPAEERFPPVNPAVTAQSDAPATELRPRSTLLPNLVTVVFVIATLGAIGLFAIIWVNPYTPLNPLAPPTPLPIIITTTPLPATATLRPSPGPTASFTPLSPEELGVTLEAPLPPATFTPALFPFTVAEPGVVYVPNANGEGCNWSSIAGSVTDLQGQPLNGYGIRIQGNNRDETVFSGSALTFGPGGFELFLNGTPQAGEYTIQLLSPSGAPVSDEYPISTLTSCEQNVAIVSFVQNRPL